MDNRIIANIRKALDSGPISGAQPKDFSVTSGRLIESKTSEDQRIALFKKRAEYSGSKVCVIDNISGLKSLFGDIIPRNSIAVSAFNNKDTGKSQQDIQESVPEGCQFLRNETISDDDLFKIDVAITDVVTAAAETGSIVINAGPLMARMKSLVCKTHIALIRPDQIQADLLDLSEQIRNLNSKEILGGFTVISGPSKTADIELQLVVGVHGPARSYLIIIRK
jgi:L-lactate utilization protein LutC